MGIATSEFVIIVKRDLIRLLRLAEELKGNIVYSNTTSNFLRLKFRGQPCSHEFVTNVVKFLRESRDLINSCRCLSTYVSRLHVSEGINRKLAAVKSCGTSCVTIGSKVLCVRSEGGINLLLEIFTTTHSLKVRAYPASAREQATSVSSLRQVVSCDDNLIRRLLSIMCELEKCLSGV